MSKFRVRRLQEADRVKAAKHRIGKLYRFSDQQRGILRVWEEQQSGKGAKRPK